MLLHVSVCQQWFTYEHEYTTIHDINTFEVKTIKMYLCKEKNKMKIIRKQLYKYKVCICSQMYWFAGIASISWMALFYSYFILRFYTCDGHFVHTFDKIWYTACCIFQRSQRQQTKSNCQLTIWRNDNK